MFKLQIIYPDVLFVINFCMDFIALYLSGLFTHLQINKKSIFLSSAIGAVYSVFAVLLGGGAALEAVIGLLVSLLICYISYGRVTAGGVFFRLFVTFYIVSFILGGAITAFYNWVDSLILKYDIAYLAVKNKKGYLFILAAVFSALIAYFFSQLFSSSCSEKRCSVVLRLDGVSKTFSGFIDSGNALRDPFSGCPVIILNSEAAEGFLPLGVLQAWRDSGCCDIKNIGKFKIRFIPCNTLGGEKILLGFKLESVEIHIEKNGRAEKYKVESIIAVDIDGREKFMGCDALVPSALLI